MYTGDTIPVLGMIHVSVQHKQARQLPLLIVKGDGPTLLGRDWLTQLRLDIDWSSVYHVPTQHTLRGGSGGEGGLWGLKPPPPLHI